MCKGAWVSNEGGLASFCVNKRSGEKFSFGEPENFELSLGSTEPDPRLFRPPARRPGGFGGSKISLEGLIPFGGVLVWHFLLDLKYF